MPPTRRSDEDRHRIGRILLVSLPAIAASVLEPVAGIVDTALLGQLDARYVAALAVTVSILSTFAWVFNFLVNGVTAQIGQAVGRRDREGLGQLIKLSLLLSLVAGAATASVLIAARPWLFGILFGAEPGLTELARPYFLLRAAGLPLVLLNLALTGILRGLQQIRLSLLLNLLVTVTNVVLTALLLFVWGLGLPGAAIGTVVSYAAGAVVGLAWLIIRRQDIGLDRRLHVPVETLKVVFADSGNLILRTASLVGSFAVTTAIVTRFGEIPLAAHQIALQLWLLSSFLIDGFAITGNMLGARHLGEGRPERRRDLGWRLLALGFIGGVAFAIVYGALRAPIQALFTADTAVVAALGRIWWILALTQPMNGLVYVYDGLLFGSRDFGYLRRHMIVGLVAVFLPLAFGLGALRGELWGVWLALTGLNLYRCASCAWKFHRG